MLPIAAQGAFALGKRALPQIAGAAKRFASSVPRLGRSAADFFTRVPGRAMNIRRQINSVAQPILQGARTGADMFYKADKVARDVAMMGIPGVSNRLNKALESEGYQNVHGAVGHGINTLNRGADTVQRIDSAAMKLIDPDMAQAAKAHLSNN